MDWLPTSLEAMQASRSRLLDRVAREGFHLHYDAKRGGGDTWRTAQRPSPACGTDGCFRMRVKNVQMEERA